MNFDRLDLKITVTGLGKLFRKHVSKNKKKTVTIKADMRTLTKKPLARKLIFVHTLFSHSTRKIIMKKFHAAKPARRENVLHAAKKRMVLRREIFSL